MAEEHQKSPGSEQPKPQSLDHIMVEIKHARTAKEGQHKAQQEIQEKLTGLCIRGLTLTLAELEFAEREEEKQPLQNRLEEIKRGVETIGYQPFLSALQKQRKLAQIKRQQEKQHLKTFLRKLFHRRNCKQFDEKPQYQEIWDGIKTLFDQTKRVVYQSLFNQLVEESVPVEEQTRWLDQAIGIARAWEKAE
jgi:hypothetical protein